MLRSFGYLKYNPKSIRGKKTRSDPWWVILRCDHNLIRYYQAWIRMSASKRVPSSELFFSKDVWPIKKIGVKLTESAWGAHISVVRGEEPKKNKKLWGKYENKRVEFLYDPQFLNTNGSHWWIRIKSKGLEEIRTELGLSAQPCFLDSFGNYKAINPFHITIGKEVG